MSGATKLDAIDAMQYHKQPAAYRQAVKDLERDLAEALAALSGFIKASQCDGKTTACPTCRRIEAARLLLSKHSKT